MAAQKSKRRSRKQRQARRAANDVAGGAGTAGAGTAGTSVTAASAAAGAGTAGISAAAGSAPPRGERGPRGERVKPRVAPGTTQAGGARTGTRRQQREERARREDQQRALASRRLGTYGERPKSVFDPVPVSEFAILAGMIAVVVGLIEHGGPALIVGAIVCALGVIEFTAREHFSGYRSHATLLAAVPAVVVEVLLAEFVGVPTRRVLLLAPVIPVFALSFWLLTRAFSSARHARVARPPASSR